MVSSHLGNTSASTIEKRVEGIWKDVLGVTEVRPDDTFFDLRGQSIAAVRIVARIEDELGISVGIGDLFEDPDFRTFVSDVVSRGPR